MCTEPVACVQAGDRRLHRRVVGTQSACERRRAAIAAGAPGMPRGPPPADRPSTARNQISRRSIASNRAEQLRRSHTGLVRGLGQRPGVEQSHGRSRPIDRAPVPTTRRRCVSYAASASRLAHVESSSSRTTCAATRSASPTRRQQTVDVVGEHRRHAAGLRRHDRQPAGKRLENRRRHVVDLGCLDVDVGVRVVLPDVFRRDAARERHATQPELSRELSQRGSSRSSADERQRRVRISALDRGKRPQRAFDVVEGLEVARGEQSRPQGYRAAGSETDRGR